MSTKQIDYILKKNGTAQVLTLTYIDDGDNSHTLPRDGCDFLTVDEMVEDIINNRAEKEVLLDLFSDKNELENIFGQIEFGRWIRNAYGLWLDIHPVTVLDDARHDLFPDQYAAQVMDKIKDRVITDKAFDAGRGAL